MNYTGPKVRLSRRVGIALTPKAAKVMRRKKGGPGEPRFRSRRRQYVSHEHFQVNGVKVKSPGFRLKPGDTLQVKEGSRKLACFREALSQAVPPVYLQVSKDELKARLVSLSKREEIPVECDLGQVIEFYSR